MTKDEMTTLLRSVCCDENTITAMCNAFDMGVEYEREACALLAGKTVCDTHTPTGINIYGTAAAKAIRARGNT